MLVTKLDMKLLEAVRTYVIRRNFLSSEMSYMVTNVTVHI